MAFCFALVLPLLLCLVGPVLAAEEDASPHEVDACQADIHRLCDKVFPDAKLVATCLVDRRAELSVPCAQLLAREGDKQDSSAQ